ncbi:fasciclin domain-containing protein [Arthrobacter sp. JSM 101049]|uniref:fasciclin domain-containing protein n=1 Tax=Arthrobacter sp. JSM 101049 TaxID=929097 RepID=UPI00356AF8A2
MKTMNRKYAALFGLLAVGSLSLSACAGGNDAGSGESSSMPMESSSSAPMSESSGSSSSAMSQDMDPAANLVGPGCEAYAKMVPDGAGSVAGMAQDPVAVAASNNPMLKTLTKAVSGELNPKVDLVDTLNSDEFTVFAPVDDAFAAIPEKDLNAVVEDADMLTKVLTYHVVPGQMTPDEITGTHKTVEGDEVKVTGSGDDLKVNDASVICGGVKTANATVYLIDQVLMPPAKK